MGTTAILLMYPTIFNKFMSPPSKGGPTNVFDWPSTFREDVWKPEDQWSCKRSPDTWAFYN